MNKHQNLAQGHDPYEDQKTGHSTGGLNPTSNDAHVPQAGGDGHVHTTNPSHEGHQHHGEHGHERTAVHHKGAHGGHVHMHEHHPKEHDGGHGGHPSHGRKKNF